MDNLSRQVSLHIYEEWYLNTERELGGFTIPLDMVRSDSIYHYKYCSTNVKRPMGRVAVIQLTAK